MAAPTLPGPLSSAASSVTATLPSGAAIGVFIRDQRQSARLSLRRLAEEAGVSNPYLSQIERGLRKPSAEILQQLAKALRLSAEQLYVQAGLLEDRGGSLAVEGAVLADRSITERQKRVLLDIYASFLAENGVDSAAGEGAAADGSTPRGGGPAKKATAKKATAKKSTEKATSRSAASKTVAKKAAAKKSTATKTSATKTSAKKVPANKRATR